MRRSLPTPACKQARGYLPAIACYSPSASFGPSRAKPPGACGRDRAKYLTVQASVEFTIVDIGTVGALIERIASIRALSRAVQVGREAEQADDDRGWRVEGASDGADNAAATSR